MKMDCQRWPETPFIMGRSGTQYVAMVTELFNCEAHLIESYCKESNIYDENWLTYFFHHIWSKFGWVYDVINWLICIFQKLKYLWNERYLKIVNSILLVIQATCVCFKMGLIGKMWFSSQYHFKYIAFIIFNVKQKNFYLPTSLISINLQEVMECQVLLWSLKLFSLNTL